jgi:hypothetical protein
VLYLNSLTVWAPFKESRLCVLVSARTHDPFFPSLPILPFPIRFASEFTRS